MPKTPAEVFGASVLRPLIDTGYIVTNRVFEIVTTGFSYFDKFASKIVMLPVAGATPSDSSGTQKEPTQIQSQNSGSAGSLTSIPDDVLLEAVKDSKNYEWIHHPNYENPTQGFSTRVFRIVSGPPFYLNGRTYQQELVHYDPKKYSHVFGKYDPAKWFHDDAKRLSFPIGKVTLFDPDQNIDILVDGNLKVLSSIEFHSKAEALVPRDEVIWRKGAGCLSPYQKFDTQSFWKKPDGTKYDSSVTPISYDFQINEITHIAIKAYSGYAHQVIKLAVSHPSNGYILVHSAYEMKDEPYLYNVEYRLKENNDNTRVCIREKKTFILPKDGCRFFGTNEKEFVIEVEDVAGAYMYRGEKDTAWRTTPWTRIRYYYSRCEDGLNSFESEQLEYDSKLPDSKTKVKTEL